MGKLFVFEGPDGNGKTTIVKAVSELLNAKNIVAKSCSFPGKEPSSLGSLIYDLHHNPSKFKVNKLNPISLQTMHVAAHIESIQGYIKPALEETEILLLDRYWWSTIVYGQASGIPESSLKKLISWENEFWQGVLPKCIFLILKKEKPFRAEMEHLHWTGLQDKYLSLSKQESKNQEVVNIYNDGSLEEIVEMIVGRILHRE